MTAITGATTSNVGFFATNTITFCLATAAQVIISGDSTLTGQLNIDDMIVYKLDNDPVIGKSFSSTCSASGFLSISSGSVTSGGSGGVGSALSLGTLSAGTHTLQIGVYNCLSTGSTNTLRLVSCSQTCPATTTTSSSTAPPGTSFTWSGNYQVTSTCNTASCCCVTGSFTLVQSGTQVTGTLGLTANCGVPSFGVVINLSSPTSTTASFSLGSQTFNVVKSGTTITLSNVQAPQCSGTATESTSSTCFHESTLVTYNGQTLSLAQIQASSNDRLDCKVPHIVRARGVIIETSCNRVLRLTEDHLVYSSKGLMAASALITGDVLFSDLDQLHPCKVIRTSQESHDQTYFGLNCAESIVLANGIKTSTFGKYHAIPAFWMKYASKIFGIERASSIGDGIANALIKMNLI